MTAIQKKEVVFSTPWFDLVAKSACDKKDEKPYYSIETLDYVSVLALTKDEKVLLVRQYRPAVEKMVTELPSGHVEKNESPEDSARRELLEETGHRVSKMQLLGSLWSDTGRLSNRIWYFFSDDAVPALTHVPEEPGIETVLMDLSDFLRAIRDLNFEHSLNLPAVLLAFLKDEKFSKKLQSIQAGF